MKRLFTTITMITFSFLFAIAFFSCKSCGGDGKIDTTVKTKEINNIHFYMETSASMAGYLKGNADFVKVIPNLLIDIENRVKFKGKPLRINYITDQITPYSKTTRDFIHDISTTSVASSKGSEMHKIFELITSHNDTNDISIFASDCILSYPDKDVINNREINVQKADGELKAFIKDAFLKMKKKNICATVYAFKSSFFGTYYNYQNGKSQINGNVIRPYYLWVIGDKDLVLVFNKQLHDMPGFKPEMEIDFGLFDKPISDYYLLFRTEKSGDWKSELDKETGKYNIEDLEIKKTKPCRFAIAVNLQTLPDYSQEVKYLQDHVIVNSDYIKCNLISVKETKDVNISKAAPKEQVNLKANTHIFVFEVSEMYKGKGTLSVGLPLIYDTQYTQWSTLNDLNLSTISGKTFAFQHLVDGVRDAYQNNTENFINISIELEK